MNNEIQRLDSLSSYDVLATSAEKEFDDITNLAVKLCEAESGFISFVDDKNVWLKSKIGIEGDTFKREDSFCNYTISQDSIFIVEDASKDKRFSDNPTINESAIKFYAGYPLRTPQGYNIGTLCVTSSVSKKLSPLQQTVLKELSSSIVDKLEKRKVSHLLREEQQSLSIFNFIHNLNPNMDIKEYQEAVLCKFTDILEIKYAFIGNVDSSTQSVTSEVCVSQGKVIDNISYSLADTPCANVYEDQDICVYGDNVCDLFPKDELLKEMGIRFYLGAPIVTKVDGDKILVVLNDSQAKNVSLIKGLASFLATKISGEIYKKTSKTQEAIIQNLMDAVDGPCFYKDSNRNIIYMNSYVTNFLEKDKSELFGKSVDDFVEGYEKSQFYQRENEVILSKKGKSFTEEFMTPNKEKRIFQTFRFPVFKDDQLEGTGLIGIDVTEEKNKEIKHFHEKRLQELGEKVAIIAHEINNPLSIILMSLDIISEKKELLTDSRLETITNAANKMKSIVKGLKSKSHNNSQSLEIIDLAQLVSDTFAPLKELYAKELDSVSIDLASDDEMTIMADKLQIQQVLTNLFRNAIDAMGDSTKKHIDIRLSKENGLVKLSIQDSGSGVDVKLQDKIFEKFFTTKDLGKGTGFGLHICKDIMSAHNGSIELIESTQGACFVFTFPTSS